MSNVRYILSEEINGHVLDIILHSWRVYRLRCIILSIFMRRKRLQDRISSRISGVKNAGIFSSTQAASNGVTVTWRYGAQDVVPMMITGKKACGR